MANHHEPAPETFSLKRRLALALGDFGFNFYWQMASLYLLYFYTDVVMLPPALAGAIYMYALLWDAMLDPLIGLVADRTRSRLGRYRPYLIFGSPVLAIIFVVAMLPPAYPATGAVVFSAITHFAFRTLYAIVSVPYAALSARITRDAAIRTDIVGYRILGAKIASVIVAAATLPFAQMIPGRAGWIVVGAVYGTIATIVILICAHAAKGLDAGTIEDAPGPTSLAKLSSIGRNYPLWLVLGAVLSAAFTSTLFSKNVVYYFKYAMGDARLAGLGLGVAALVGAVTAPPWAKLARTQGKRLAWLYGIALQMAGLVLFWYGHGSVTWLYVALSLFAVGFAAYAVCYWAMLPDTVEYGEWRTGVRAESLVFGVVVLAQKAALGLAAGLLGWLLADIGYHADQVQSAETLLSLREIMLFGPAAALVVTGLLVALYPISPQFHQQLNREIDAREKAAAASAG